MNNEFQQLGNHHAKPSKKLETFPHTHPGDTTITLTTKELLCNCPVTNQPDYYDCTISYVAGNECIETKSLKFFLLTFKGEAHFAEDLAHLIRDAIVSACPSASNVSVDLTQQIRGAL